jgi:hypothetical protein
MRSKITKTINEWDPINLFPMAPADEYTREIDSIDKIIHDNTKISVDNLAIEIHQLFTKRFGRDVYLREEKECLKVAAKILELR